MHSFVRSLIENRQTASGALATVIDEVVAGVSDGEAPELSRSPGYVDGLVRRALLREAITALSSTGHLPLVVGDALWSGSLDPSPLDRSCRSLCLVTQPGTLAAGIEALSARGFVLHRDGDADWFSLEGLPSLLCVRERLRDPIAPFRLDIDAVRGCALLDSESYGAPALVPMAEDGLCAWAIDAAEALLHGRSPNWLDAAYWQERHPSDAVPLAERAARHRIHRLLPTLLVAAHDVSGNRPLANLARALGYSPATELGARLCLRSFDGTVTDRRLGALVLYALAPDLDAARRALAERSFKWATRVVSKR